MQQMKRICEDRFGLEVFVLWSISPELTSNRIEEHL
jgi:hypothetical protein